MAFFFVLLLLGETNGAFVFSGGNTPLVITFNAATGSAIAGTQPENFPQFHDSLVLNASLADVIVVTKDGSTPGFRFRMLENGALALMSNDLAETYAVFESPSISIGTTESDREISSPIKFNWHKVYFRLSATSIFIITGITEFTDGTVFALAEVAIYPSMKGKYIRDPAGLSRVMMDSGFDVLYPEGFATVSDLFQQLSIGKGSIAIPPGLAFPTAYQPWDPQNLPALPVPSSVGWWILFTYLIPPESRLSAFQSLDQEIQYLADSSCVQITAEYGFFNSCIPSVNGVMQSFMFTAITTGCASSAAEIIPFNMYTSTDCTGSATSNYVPLLGSSGSLSNGVNTNCLFQCYYSNA